MVSVHSQRGRCMLTRSRLFSWTCVLRDTLRGIRYESQIQNNRRRNSGTSNAWDCHDCRYSLPH